MIVLVQAEHLAVTYAYYGAARGRWDERGFGDGEQRFESWGETTGDLFLNDEIYFANVPSSVWRYELGGYPVLKKWLGYRQASRRGGQPLSLAEARHFRSMVHRLAALLLLHPRLDELYALAAEDAFSAEELGLR